MKSLLKGMISDICGEDLFNSIINVLTKDPFTEYEAVAGVMRSLYDIVMSAAIMLMFIYFLIAVVDKLTSENFSWEQLWKQFAMLLAAKLVIEHGLEIMTLMSAVGVELVELISQKGDVGLGVGITAAEADAIIASFEEKYSFGGLFKVIGDLILFLQLILPWLFSWIMRIAVKIICYTRLIEIYIRASFAPLALSDFFKNGFQGGGWRFLKSFFAVCLQGAIILGIAIFFSALCESLLPSDKTNLFTFLGYYFAIGCSAIMLMFRSLSLSKEIMGAN